MSFTTKIQYPVLDEYDERTRLLQSKLKLKHGTLHEEYPEQKLAVKFLTGKEKVLEIGGNIGRNSLIISSLLENQENLVVLECDDTSVKKLTENRELNGFKFHIEPSALSKRSLINSLRSNGVIEKAFFNSNTTESMNSNSNIDTNA